MSVQSNYPHPILAKEGWPFIGIAVFLALFIHFLGGFGWALPFYIIAIFVVLFACIIRINVEKSFYLF